MRRRARGLLVLLLALAIMLAGCRSERTKPGLDVAAEQRGEGISITVKTTGFKVPQDGHIHIRLDDGPETMAYSYAYTIPKVSPGRHKVEVGLSDLQHRDLGVTQVTEVEVK